MKWTFKRVMAQTFLTHIGRMGFSALLLMIGGLVGCDWLMYIGGGVLAIEILIFIVHAWIINPIKDRKK